MIGNLHLLNGTSMQRGMVVGSSSPSGLTPCSRKYGRNCGFQMRIPQHIRQRIQISKVMEYSLFGIRTPTAASGLSSLVCLLRLDESDLNMTQYRCHMTPHPRKSKKIAIFWTNSQSGSPILLLFSWPAPDVSVPSAGSKAQRESSTPLNH